MTKNDKKESSEQIVYATDLQIKTIKELYSELDYDKHRSFDDKDFPKLSKQDAGEHLEYLIKLKRATTRNGNGKQNGFDKIGYSMIYKLVWRNWGEISKRNSTVYKCLKDVVLEEYQMYKEALEFAEKAVKGSGQK